MTQRDLILEALRLRGDEGLTQLEALRMGGGMRLAARIAELRGDGHDIRSEMVEVENGARVARYTLHVADQRSLGL